MSPSEFDLRAALRDGEGDDVRIERVLAAGREVRRTRRVRLLSGAAVAALVAGLSVGIVKLAGSSGSGSGGRAEGAAAAASSGEATVFGPAAGPNGGHSGDKAGSATAGSTAAGSGTAPLACPRTAPHYLLPGGGSSGQFGSTQPLFAQRVASVVVCAYGSPDSTTGVTPDRLLLTGADATALADSLQAASTSRSVHPCPQASAGRSPQQVALIGVTAGGTALKAVTATLTDPPCNVTVTNGTAIRYQWQPPTSLLNRLLALNPVR